MADWQGLWSYVHADDEAEDGRIRRLAQDVAAQFAMQSGEEIHLFLDKDAIEWGERWRGKVDDALASVAFFIPVLTPRYFMSAECRRELQSFARKAIDLGLKELVLPLLYVDIESLHEETPSDDLMALVREFQWRDWCELRFAEPSSEVYRKGVSQLAERLVKANTKPDLAGMIPRPREGEGAVDEAVDDSPGLLDRLASSEDAFPAWTVTLESIGQNIELIGEIMQQAVEDTEKADSQGKGFAGRLVVARRVSQQLIEPAESIRSLGNDFASRLHAVDEGTRVLIALLPGEIEENPDSRAEACEFFQALRELSATTHVSLDSVQEMVDGIAPLESQSRDLRPPLRSLRQGLTMMLEAREVADEWVRLMDDAGIDCDDDPRPES